MKILIICRGKSNIICKKRYHSTGFDEACRLAAECDIEKAEKERISSNGRPVYVSSEKSTGQTANLIFSDADIIKEPLLDEVPLRSYKDTEKELPLWYWQFMASVQRFFGNSRQPETKSQVKTRAKSLLDLLESRNQNCILISHPVFIKVLLSQFSARGYCIAGRSFLRIAPLQRIVITKWDMHCGGCGHNCLLSNPGCGVGRDAGKRASK